VAVGSEDLYDVLGVSRDASADDIRAAYRRLARENHPDVNKDPGAEDRFKAVSEAYDVLRDPEKRADYDRLGASWRTGGPPPRRGAAGFGGAGGRGGGAGPGGFRAGPGPSGFGAGAPGGFRDIFEDLFGGGGFDGASMRGSDQEATLELTLEEAANGGKRRISLADGRDFEVTIPRGVRDGQLIRLAGEGEPGPGGGPSGDLLLRVRLLPHPRFRVEGSDLVTDLPVSPWEAALGAEVPVPTLDGTARVRVPAGSSTGRRLRLRGQGLPDRGGGTGDLFAELEVHVPPKLSAEERTLFERLAEVSDFDPRSEPRPRRRFRRGRSRQTTA
jgi:curved DNA-binding protein